MKKILVGLQKWTPNELEHVLSYPNEQVSGIILGDPFCEYHMFQHGDFDLIEFAEKAKTVGKVVVYQTPAYLTHPIFDKTLSIIQYLEKKKVCDWILAQDVGLIHLCSKNKTTIPICWSVWGYNRSNFISYNLVNFLMSIGIQGIEINNPGWGEHVSFLNLQVFLNGYAPTVVSFRQTCYVESVYKTHCNNGDLCQKSMFIIQDIRRNQTLTVNGYVLEMNIPPKLIQSETPPDWYTIHLQTSDRLGDLLKKVSENEPSKP